MTICHHLFTSVNISFFILLEISFLVNLAYYGILNHAFLSLKTLVDTEAGW